MSAGGWDLVAAARDGDRTAAHTLYERYQAYLAGYVRRRVVDRDTAADLTQDAWVAALAGLSTARDQGRDVGCWLSTIARNKLIDHARSHHTRRTHLVERVPDTPDPASDPADVITRGELVATTQVVVRAALAQLPPDQRRVIYARYWAQRSAREIATEWDRTEGAIRALTARGFASLRAQLSAVREDTLGVGA
jgi:RNA polymerase sigma-70 factor (ECF subfamily)